MRQLRKFLYGCIALLVAGLSLHAQSVEDQLLKPITRCEDVRHNALAAIPRMYKEQPIDSVIRAISFWEDKCKSSEELQRIKILVAIKNRHFTELLYDSTIIHYIDQFKAIKDITEETGAYQEESWYRNYREERNLLVQYNAFTRELARSLLSIADSTSLESYFCHLYADTGNIKTSLDNPRFANTSLSRYYNQHQRQLRKQSRNFFTIVSGIWIPTGAATLLGNHPYIGMELGNRDDKNRINLTFYFKFINSPNTYQIKRNNQFYDTDDFFGGYFGLEYARKVVGNNTHLLEAVAGAGLDGFDVYHTSDESEREQMKPLSVLSYNFNGGLQYNVFLGKNKSTMLGLQAKYNFTNYRNKGATDLKGNPITIGLVLGFFSPANPYSYWRGYY